MLTIEEIYEMYRIRLNLGPQKSSQDILNVFVAANDLLRLLEENSDYHPTSVEEYNRIQLLRDNGQLWVDIFFIVTKQDVFNNMDFALRAQYNFEDYFNNHIENSNALVHRYNQLQVNIKIVLGEPHRVMPCVMPQTMPPPVVRFITPALQKVMQDTKPFNKIVLGGYRAKQKTVAGANVFTQGSCENFTKPKFEVDPLVWESKLFDKKNDKENQPVLQETSFFAWQLKKPAFDEYFGPEFKAGKLKVT